MVGHFFQRIIIIIITNVLVQVIPSRERCRGTLQSHNNSEEGNESFGIGLSVIRLV